MSPASLVVLTGDREPYPDNDFMGSEYMGEGFFEMLSRNIREIGNTTRGYGIQTPGGGLAVSEQGLNLTKGGASGPGALPASAGGAMSMIKNPVVIGGAALIALLLILKKR
jgi:hypothetical protein